MHSSTYGGKLTPPMQATLMRDRSKDFAPSYGTSHFAGVWGDGSHDRVSPPPHTKGATTSRSTLPRQRSPPGNTVITADANCRSKVYMCTSHILTITLSKHAPAPSVRNQRYHPLTQPSLSSSTTENTAAASKQTHAPLFRPCSALKSPPEPGFCPNTTTVTVPNTGTHIKQQQH